MKKVSSVGWDVVYLTGSKFLVALIGLVSSMLLARFRTLDEYGTYSQLIMIINLLCSLLLLGIPNSVSYFLAKANTEQDKQKFLSVYITLCTLLSVIIGISLYISIPMIIVYFDNPMIESFAYVFGVYPWSSIMISSISNTCIVYGKAKKLIFYNFANAVITLSLILIAKMLGWSFQVYMQMYMVSLLLFACIGLGWIKSFVGKMKLCMDWLLIREIINFSLPMGLASIVGTLNVELDKLIIGGFFSTDEYAIFANAAKEMPITIVTVSLTAVLLPQMVKMFKNQNISGAIEMWGYSIELSLCFMCFIVGIFLVFSQDIISFLYSEKYVTVDSVIIFRIYSSILLFRAIYWGIVLNASGKTKFIFYSSIITLLFNVVGNIFFYYILGFIGPAVSTFLVTAVMAYIQLKFTASVIKKSIKDFFPWRNALKLIVEMIIFCFLFAAIKCLIGEFERTISIIISVGLSFIWFIGHLIINYKRIKYNWRYLNSYKYECK